MLLNKATLRKASSRAALLLATGSLLATGISPAHALDATPLYINFESSDPLKALAASAEGPFGNASAEVKAGTNLTTGDSLHFTKSVGATPWAGVNILGATSTPYGYTAADKKVVTFDYWSPDAGPSPVMLKLEAPAATLKAVEAQPGFNTISVDFTGVASWGGGYTKLIIFPNFGSDDATYTGAPAVGNTGQVYEIDNISINGGTAADIYVPVVPATREATSTLMTFETGEAYGAAAVGAGFNGAVTLIKDAPAGGNGGKALEIEKAGDPWSGVNLITAGAGLKFLDAANKTVTMNYYSPETVNTPVQFQLVASDASKINQAVEAVPGWQKLTFDFTASYDAAKTYTAGVIFPNFVNAGDVPGYTGAAAVSPLTGKKYFIDNVGFNGATTPGIPLPRTATPTLLTFETGDTLGAKVAGLATNAKPEGGFEGAGTTIEDAPAGGNGGKALKIVKNVGAQVYAGVNVIKFAADTRVTNATYKTITFNYYSPKANSPTRIELRPYPAALGKTVNAPLGWSKIVVDFSDVAGWTSTEEFVSVALFPDFDQAAGTVAQSYYVDNLSFNGALTPSIPVVVPKVKPSASKAATTAGTAKVAKTLTAGKGTWTGSATIAYTYKWYRCTVASATTAKAVPTASAKCATISGATKSTYKLASADVGKYVRVLVTATNTAGTAYSLSKTTSKVVK
jgi:hypothetical protein